MQRLQDQRHEAEVAGYRADVGEVGFGFQVRNYTLAPYTLVKDLRTGVETPAAGAVLDGELEPFIEAGLGR